MARRNTIYNFAHSVNAKDHGSGSEPFASRLSKLMSNLLREWNESPRLVWEVKNLCTVL
jgi:hypothetical protein